MLPSQRNLLIVFILCFYARYLEFITTFVTCFIYFSFLIYELANLPRNPLSFIDCAYYGQHKILTPKMFPTLQGQMHNMWAMISFDEGVPADDSVRDMVQKLMREERFRSVVEYEEGASFLSMRLREIIRPSIHSHFESITVETEEILGTAKSLSSTKFDHYKDSPWKIWLISNPERTVGKIVCVINHCIMDGLGAMKLIQKLFDDENREMPIYPEFKKRQGSNPLPFSHRFREAFKLLGEGRKPDAKSVINDYIGGVPLGVSDQYDIHLSEPVGLKVLKYIKEHEGVSVNDVVYTALSRALRRFFLKKNQDLELSRLSAMCVVGLKYDGPTRNEFVFATLDLCVKESTRHDTLQAVVNQWNIFKYSFFVPIFKFMLKAQLHLGLENLALWQWMPVKTFLPSFLAAGSTLTYPTVVYSNVPGPQTELYLGKCKIANMHASTLALIPIFTPMSYNGKISMTYTAPKKVDGISEVVSGWYEEIQNWHKDITKAREAIIE